MISTHVLLPSLSRFCPHVPGNARSACHVIAASRCEPNAVTRLRNDSWSSSLAVSSTCSCRSIISSPRRHVDLMRLLSTIARNVPSTPTCLTWSQKRSPRTPTLTNMPLHRLGCGVLESRTWNISKSCTPPYLSHRTYTGFMGKQGYQRRHHSLGSSPFIFLLDSAQGLDS